MIGRVQKRGNDTGGLLTYLYGPGRQNEHLNPRLVAGWMPVAGLELPVRLDGGRDFSTLAGLLELPLALRREPVPDGFVWHCSLRAAEEDPELSDEVWKRTAEEVMHRTGLSSRDDEDAGVRWVAVHHGDRHVHLVAVLARQDGRPVRLHNSYYRIAEALRWAEQEYGLRVGAQADRTAPRRPTLVERKKALAAGWEEPARVTLRRIVEASAAVALTEQEFLEELERHGTRVRLRTDSCSAEATGYAVNLPADVDAEGEPIWFGGGKLAADLTLPKLRRRWVGLADAGQEVARFAVADAEQIVGHVANVATWAAQQLLAGGQDLDDVATAASSLFATAADVVPDVRLRRAADEFSRAARAQWGRVPEVGRGGRHVRVAAYLLSACRRVGSALRKVGRKLFQALRSLAETMAGIRSRQGLVLQADAARRALAEVSACTEADPYSAIDDTPVTATVPENAQIAQDIGLNARSAGTPTTVRTVPSGASRRPRSRGWKQGPAPRSRSR